MIGIVIVSHSARLAEGVVELAGQMAQGEALRVGPKGQVPLAAAGGIDDPAHPLGTDPTKVLAAIEAVYSDDGVVVLMDLGSALLSAEMALEFLPEERRAKVRLCPAPLVEGAVAAAVQVLAGASLEQVVAEAQGALASKAAQLGAPGTAAPPTVFPEPASERTIERVIMLHNALGLHARPAAQLVRTAAQFQARVTLQNLSEAAGPVDAHSIVQVLMLGARKGHRLALRAEGPEAEAALEALVALMEAGFGEPDELPTAVPSAPPSPAAPVSGELVGVAASPGIALGPLLRYRAAPLRVEEQPTDTPEKEWQRLQTALAEAEAEIQALRARTQTQLGEEQAAIFDAHRLFLEDPALAESTRGLIMTRQASAEFAWQQTVEALVARYRALQDPYLQARVADLSDVGQRVLAHLVPVASAAAFDFPEPGILVAEDLTPSECDRLDPARVLGIALAGGNATAHSAILIRTLEIPLVVGLGPRITALPEGTPLALDGGKGRVWVAPGSELRATLEAQRAAWLEARQAARVVGQRPARTRDGQRIAILANIGGLNDLQRALDYGAEGVGVLRTEFLYLNRATAPSEDEQYAAYRTLAETLGTRPLVIRTLDIGGDKPLPYLDLPPEANPFLGWRGLRIGLAQPDLFIPQLRAILRAAPGHALQIMFPMVSTVAEIRAARALLEEAQANLRRAGVPLPERLPVGIMVEVPAAVALAEQLAREVDFMSIGTNDLSQYLMAADRTNPRVALLADHLQPAVLRAVRTVLEAAWRAGIHAALCGELAGEPLATPLLLGLGLEELSMNPPAIPIIKQFLSQLTQAEAEAALADALALDSAEAVRRMMAERFAEHLPQG